MAQLAAAPRPVAAWLLAQRMELLPHFKSHQGRRALPLMRATSRMAAATRTGTREAMVQCRISRPASRMAMGLRSKGFQPYSQEMGVL